jgi:3-hydroxyacyl-CoA dehydrogenase/enoyl-CoA hydratase/3-hydroxybutyryl-CoA epimerase/enoyl-CoA isomerase
MEPMRYLGKSIECLPLDGGLYELRFDAKEDSVNKFNSATLKELGEALAGLQGAADFKGLLVTSGKDVFIVGADVTEFLTLFQHSEEELTGWLLQVDEMFNTIEDLPGPSVVAINGVCLGGGFELALAASYRVMAADTKVGLPETKLGIFPGWGGTVRLSRLCGADNAIEWIAGGEQNGAADALKIGAVDAVTAPAELREVALQMLNDAVAGKLDWQARQAEKKAPLSLNAVEAGLAFETSKAFVAGKAGPNYPSPVVAIEVMQKGAKLGRDEALKIEAAAFAKIAKGPVAHSLVSVFLGDQLIKKVSKKVSKAARPVNRAAVLGAGIMGGGIAYQSASRGVPILMKDIAPKALELGMGEAIKLLSKQVERGKATTEGMARTLGAITPTLSLGDINLADIVVEAVVENEKIKQSVLAEVEALVKAGTVLASNTSTISISRLAEGLRRPEDFCGMHFFNPVPRMPLVEVIRGAKSSDTAIATTVAYALAMGKTPIVVGDCPGFLVNRVLFPYFSGFEKLLNDGVDYKRIDKVMEKWGWPMGPAYLLDVVGIDTGVHADKVMAAGFPDRMAHEGRIAIEAMVEAQRFGQKNGKGFYQYEPQKKGAPKKLPDPVAEGIVAGLVKVGGAEVTDMEIVERMMLPMFLECSRCLEDGIVATPTEVDIALIYGLGFPPFRGGIFRWADSLGAENLLKAAEKYVSLGNLYAPTAQLKALAASGKTFHQ